jgi:hypothetical protein
LSCFVLKADVLSGVFFALLGHVSSTIWRVKIILYLFDMVRILSNFYTVSFRQSLIDAGFYIRTSFPFVIDKPRAAAFFCVTVRTLERWIKTNSPCPRASAMLEMRGKSLVNAFNEFTICKDGLLWCDTFKQGKRPSDLRMLEHYMASNARLLRELGQMQSRINDLQNADLIYQKRETLKRLSNELLSLTNSRLFDKV